ncbi:hypothetical protein [uncultured Ilyobacter sp.]|nr:hypothetical protein [uncultured Ilyobacter sp.]
MRNFQKKKKRVLRRYLKKLTGKAKRMISEEIVEKKIVMKVELPKVAEN